VPLRSPREFRAAPCARRAFLDSAQSATTAAAGVRRNHGKCAFLPVNLLAFSDSRRVHGALGTARVLGSFAYDRWLASLGIAEIVGVR